jgi:hypothetical protein
MNNRVVPIPGPGPPTSPRSKATRRELSAMDVKSRDGDAGAGAPRDLDTMASHSASHRAEGPLCWRPIR